MSTTAIRRPPPPPPPRARRMPPPPPPPRDDELAEMRLDNSHIADFCAGRFELIPPACLARLYAACADLGKPEVRRSSDAPRFELMRAVFVHTDFPRVSWQEAAEQLKETISTRTPFAAISRRCLEWLDNQLSFDAERERRQNGERNINRDEF